LLIPTEFVVIEKLEWLSSKREKKQSDDWSARSLRAYERISASKKLSIAFKSDVMQIFIRVSHTHASLRVLHAQAGKDACAPVV
jgi:hypothetical protein